MKDYKTLFGSLVNGDWPNTVAKNASGPSAVDGTPFTKDLIDDIWGGRIDLMVRAGLTPDGIAEANGTSQFVKALYRVIRGPGELVESALNAATLATRVAAGADRGQDGGRTRPDRRARRRLLRRSGQRRRAPERSRPDR